MMGGSSKSLRGLNKPKCIKCGNVARSRCPFQSCKSCCAEAENQCHIHFLKAHATFPDKILMPGSTVSGKQSTESSPSGITHRMASLRQLSNIFAQFNNVQSPLRSRKLVSRNEAAIINEWRFQKLKEYKEGIIETENEAFDRYMHNISLLEEVVSVNDAKPEGPIDDLSPISENGFASAEEINKRLLSVLRLKQRSNPIRSENLRKRVQAIVDQGLKKLHKIDSNRGENDPNKEFDLMMKDERTKFWSAERESSMNDLLERLNKARSEDDLKSCVEIKSDIFGWDRGKSPMQSEGTKMSSTEISENDVQLQSDYYPMQNEGTEMSTAEVSENDIQFQSDYYPPKWLITGYVDQDAFIHIDLRFSSTEEIESL